LTQENGFRFDLNEYLYFQKGHEVAELIGISLEPDISIYEANDYISIRGVIELTGEYLPHDDNDVDEYNHQVLSFQERQSRNYIQDIRSYDDGLSEFHYNIPVEVTVPKYRVPSLDDVMVEIDYFDYEIPDPSTLKLQAEVLITGIKQDVDYPSTSTEDAVSEEARDNWEDISQPFSFDINMEEDENRSLEESQETFIPELPSVPEFSNAESEENAEISLDDDKDRDLWFKKTTTQSFDEFFGHKKEEIKEEHSPEFKMNVEHSGDDSEVIMEEVSDRPEEDSKKESRPLMEEEEEGPKIESHPIVEDEEKENEEGRKDDVFYLFNMFHDKEERFSKIRMCIVQETDTLDSIAERYHLSKSQIVKHNKLNNDEVKPGEILYIPRTKQKETS
jgi:stage VI sporulation protein D